MSKQYRSEAWATVHETALGLHEAGATDKQTLKVFDENVSDAGRTIDAEPNSTNPVT